MNSHIILLMSFRRLYCISGCQTIDKVSRFYQCLPIKSSDFIVQHKTRYFLNDKIDERFGYRSTDFVCFHGDCLQWKVLFILFVTL